MVHRKTMEGKVCLVTGGNAGIGKAVAWELAGTGATVGIVARNKERGEAALTDIRRRSGSDDVRLHLADLADQSQIRSLAVEVKEQYERLDVLINNAAIIPQQRQTTPEGLEMQFAVNHLAPFLLTQLLIDRLKASTPARIINVSSGTHRGATLDFNDLQNEDRYDASRVYAETKLANVLFTYELARRLESSGVTANTLHPGVIATKLNAAYRGGSRSGDVPPSEAERGAETIVYLATSPEVADVSGRYFANREVAASAPQTHDEALARKLWQVSVTLTGEDNI